MYVFPSGLVILALLILLVHAHSFLIGQKMGMLWRVTATTAIHKKVRQTIVNLSYMLLCRSSLWVRWLSVMYRLVMWSTFHPMMCTDSIWLVNLTIYLPIPNNCGSHTQALMFFHYVWIAPFQVIAFCYLVYIEFGWSAFIGVFFMILVIFTQFFAAKLFAYYR